MCKPNENVLLSGLLRRNDEANRFPLGILPLGRTNAFGNSLFPGGDGVEKVKQLIDASMAIIEGNTVWKDAMKIEPLPQEEEEAPSRPIYALTSLEWGAFRDTLAKKDKYWFCGSLRDYAAFIFNGYKDSLSWNCSGIIKYTPPCPGCSNCLKMKPEVKRKWLFFVPSMEAAQSDSSKILNPECATSQELCFKTCEFKIQPYSVQNHLPALGIVLGRSTYSYTDFVSEGWSRVKKKESYLDDVISARTVELIPNKPTNEVMIEIDKEEFEVKPVRITLLPKVVKLFCKSGLNNV